MPSCRGSSLSSDQTNVSCIGRQIPYNWTTWEALGEEKKQSFIGREALVDCLNKVNSTLLDGRLKLVQRIRKRPTHVNRDVDRHSRFTNAEDRSVLQLSWQEGGSLTPARHTDLLSQDHWPAAVTCKTYRRFTVWGIHVPLQKPLKLCLLWNLWDLEVFILSGFLVYMLQKYVFSV